MFSYGRLDRAFEIDLTIQSHKNLNCLNPRICRRKLCSLLRKFVRQILNGMAEYLKCPSRPGVDHAPPVRSRGHNLCLSATPEADNSPVVATIVLAPL
jgi:hypothetical protein